MSFRDISKLRNGYDKNLRLQQTKKEENNLSSQREKLSLSSRAFTLFRKGKTPVEVKVLLDIPFKKVLRYWSQFLKSIRMFESFEFYQDHSLDIPTLLSIDTFMKRNNISADNIINILRSANDVNNMNQMISNLKVEISRLEGKIMSLSYYAQSNYGLQPLHMNKQNYNYYRY